MSNNCYIGTSDSLWLKVYDRDMTIDYFGEDYLLEYGNNIPQELVDRYKKNYEEFKTIQKELRNYVFK